MEKPKPQGLEKIAEEDWQPFEACNVIPEEEKKEEELEELAPMVSFQVNKESTVLEGAVIDNMFA